MQAVTEFLGVDDITQGRGQRVRRKAPGNAAIEGTDCGGVCPCTPPRTPSLHPGLCLQGTSEAGFLGLSLRLPHPLSPLSLIYYFSELHIPKIMFIHVSYFLLHIGLAGM